MATTRKSTSKKTAIKKFPKTPVKLLTQDWTGRSVMYYDISNYPNSGEYTPLAFVHNNGVIRWDVDKNTLPSKIVYKILQKSRENARKNDEQNIIDNEIFDAYILRHYNKDDPKLKSYNLIPVSIPLDLIESKRRDTNWEYNREKQKYLDTIINREKAIHSYPANRRR